MSVVKKFLLLCCIVGIASVEVWGQASSPFTTFGIGEPYGNSLIHNQGMGGVGVSQPQFWFLNNQNPALLVYNSLTVFEAGIVGERRTIKGDTLNEKNSGGNMNYLVVAFPVKVNKWTTSLGLMPYSNVEFGFQSDTTFNLGDGQSRKAQLFESATGGLTQLYWSNGIRLNRRMSVGLKATYLFGQIDDVYSNQLQDTPHLITREEKTSVKDFNFSLGYSFSKDSLWGKNYRFSVGAVYNFSANLNAKQTDHFYRTTVAGDTLENYSLGTFRPTFKIPPALTVGVSLSRGLRWSVATEFAYQDWTDYKTLNPEDDPGKSWRAALGGEVTPDPVSLGSYLKRITYRAGVSMEQYPYLAAGNTVKDIGVNFGFSLPAGRSSLDMAVKIGKRGNKADNLLEESYFKIFFGVTFNDQWFIKRKFD